MYIVVCNEWVCFLYKKKCFDDWDFLDMMVSLDWKIVGLGILGLEVLVLEYFFFVDEGYIYLLYVIICIWKWVVDICNDKKYIYF